MLYQPEILSRSEGDQPCSWNARMDALGSLRFRDRVTVASDD